MIVSSSSCSVLIANLKIHLYLPIAVMLVVDHDMMIVVTDFRMVLYSMFYDSHHLHLMQHSIVVLMMNCSLKYVEREANLD